MHLLKVSLMKRKTFPQLADLVVCNDTNIQFHLHNSIYCQLINKFYRASYAKERTFKVMQIYIMN